MLTAPVIDGGNVVGLLGIVRDMSEEKLLIRAARAAGEARGDRPAGEWCRARAEQPPRERDGFLAARACWPGRRCGPGRSSHDPRRGQARREDRLQPPDVRAPAPAAADDDAGEAGHLDVLEMRVMHSPFTAWSSMPVSMRPCPRFGPTRSSFNRSCSISSGTPSTRSRRGMARSESW